MGDIVKLQKQEKSAFVELKSQNFYNLCSICTEYFKQMYSVSTFYDFPVDAAADAAKWCVNWSLMAAKLSRSSGLNGGENGSKNTKMCFINIYIYFTTTGKQTSTQTCSSTTLLKWHKLKAT